MNRNTCIAWLAPLTMLTNIVCGQQQTFTTKNPKIVGVKTSSFSGSIFNESYDCGPLYVRYKTYRLRFTPSIADVRKAEQILDGEIDSVIMSNTYLRKTEPQINKHLNEYFRQYVGYINDKGEKLIYLNSHWNVYSDEEKIQGIPDHRLNDQSDYIEVNDGGSYHWQSVINLNNNQVVEFTVNGDA